MIGAGKTKAGAKIGLEITCDGGERQVNNYM